MSEEDKAFLEKYDDSKYEKPSVTADIAIFTIQEIGTDNYRKLSEKRLKLLLIKRGQSPFVGEYALPGGFAHKGETVDDAARRELLEETGVECNCLEQVRVFSEPGRDPRRWVITTAFLALLDSTELAIAAGDDASAAEWFDVFVDKKKGNIEVELSGSDTTIRIQLKEEEAFAKANPVLSLVHSENIAFDHGLIIGHAILQLQKWMRDTNIGFSLLPEHFTLTQLQQVYEAVLGEKLYPAAFRRKMISLLEETDKMTEDAGHRPSRLYRMKRIQEEWDEA